MGRKILIDTIPCLHFIGQAGLVIDAGPVKNETGHGKPLGRTFELNPISESKDQFSREKEKTLSL